MNITKLTLVILSLMTAISATGQEKCPILLSTTMITYYAHPATTPANYSHGKTPAAGFASYKIYADSLVEGKNVYHYDKLDFQNLLKELSAIEFSVVKQNRPTLGGADWSLSFYKEDECYLSYHKRSELSGNHKEVKAVILKFATTHKNKKE